MPGSKTRHQTKIKGASDHLDELIGRLESGENFDFSPAAFGLPSAFHSKEELGNWIEENLLIIKDGRSIPVVLIDQHREVIWDYWTGKTTTGIIWKNRGGGGSLVASIIIVLKMIWNRFSFVDLAGSGDQAKNVYEYATGFLSKKCLGTKVQLIDGEALKANTKLKSGAWLSCIPASEKAARGKHPPGLIIDEACQKDTTVDVIIETALNMVFSEEEYCVLALSTFHVAYGWFQTTWDNAVAQGWKKYKWDVYDCMRKCEEKIDCRNCPLTEKVPVRDQSGRVIRYKYDGCYGKARKSRGWMKRSNVLDAKRKNTRETWRVEFECKRPTTKGRVIPKPDLDAAFTNNVDKVRIIKGARTAVGLDWGFGAQTAVIPVQRHSNHVAVPNEAFFTSTSTSDIISYLKRLRKMLGDFEVLADASHPFNNLDLHNAGFTVRAIPFNQYKKFGVDNYLKYFESWGKLYISDKCTILYSQLDRLVKNEKGDIVKKNDHGPDALLCALLEFIFLSEFPQGHVEDDEDDAEGEAEVFEVVDEGEDEEEDENIPRSQRRKRKKERQTKSRGDEGVVLF